MFKFNSHIYLSFYFVILQIVLWMQIYSTKSTECRIKTPVSERELQCHHYEGNACSLHRNDLICDKTSSRSIPQFDLRPIQEKSQFQLYNSGFEMALTIPKDGSSNTSSVMIKYQSDLDMARCVVTDEIDIVELYTDNKTKDMEIFIKIFPVKGKATFKFTMELLCQSKLNIPSGSLIRWGNSGYENWTLGWSSSAWRTTITYAVDKRTIKVWFVKAPDRYRFYEYVIILRRISPNGDQMLNLLEVEKRISKPEYVFKDIPPGRYKIWIKPFDDKKRSLAGYKCKNKYGNPQVCRFSKTDIIEIGNNSEMATHLRNKATLNPVVLSTSRSIIRILTTQSGWISDDLRQRLNTTESKVFTDGGSTTKIKDHPTRITYGDIATQKSSATAGTTTGITHKINGAAAENSARGGTTQIIRVTASVLAEEVKNPPNIDSSKTTLLTTILGILCMLVVIMGLLGVYRLYRKGCSVVIANKKTKHHTLRHDKTCISHQVNERQISASEHTGLNASSENTEVQQINQNDNFDINTCHDCSKFINKQISSDSGYVCQNKYDKFDDAEWQDAGQSLIIEQLVSNQHDYVDDVYFDEVSLAPAITLVEGQAGQYLHNPDHKGIPLSGMLNNKTQKCNNCGNEYILQYCRIQDTNRCNCEPVTCNSTNFDKIVPMDINFTCLPPEDNIDGSICTADLMAGIRELNKSSLMCPAKTDTISGISV